MPLLGATLVAILAFMPLAFNPTGVGEFLKSLFYVLAISLFLSWVLAMHLCRQIGVDLSTNLAVTVDNLVEPQLPAAGLDADKALDARPETKILEGQVAIADYQRKNAMALKSWMNG